MATQNTQSFSGIVANFAAAVQGAASQLVDFSVGSILNAIAEAVAGVALWLQGLYLQVLALTRAATSNGTDLDSWFADYGFARAAAQAATGFETFSRYTPTNQALIPIGATVQTQDGTIVYSVVVDTTNPAYSSTQGGYVIPAGQASMQVPIQCTAAGAAGNVSAGQLNTIGTAIAGIDYVSNGSAIVNGADAQSDASARASFVLWIASLSKATLAAVEYAIQSVQQGVTYSITENQDYNGATDNGFFYAVVDDGTGAPSPTFIASEAAAIEAVRPIGIRYGVFGPVDLTANITMTLTTAAGYTHSVVVAAVSAALQAYIDTLGVGNPLRYSQLATIAYNTEPVGAITNVSGVLLNGVTADLVPTNQQICRAGTLTIN
ncbi:baseplate J/gp47 family protein [Burkholderia multivorans]|uniref:baseplate J/gp47 family protein n=1 Tax=Burkholderia multivorans TaxID=87883 RepID=UPI0021C1F069|nr:baseplate J/gp47 family protein [Burkholderia multivorans]MDR9052051.1 hypothetical protein [Burkholderia multivorans]MDR9060123.1 hypothetical protein [Burkholderia multivorans]MDR9062428.1 hypothetical protein [Burkholderia multivorans]MDR9072224.1 hypothetical protein [Burkholderia multivorans]MDR9076549.1 hypothetical protein [Burkholderia multivorans]